MYLEDDTLDLEDNTVHLEDYTLDFEGDYWNRHKNKNSISIRLTHYIKCLKGVSKPRKKNLNFIREY
jgi:hypothetical protein